MTRGFPPGPAGGWRAERARGGSWCAVREEPAPPGFSPAGRVRRRRDLGVPAGWTRAEVESHIRRLVAEGSLY